MTDKENEIAESLRHISTDLEAINNTIKEVCSKSKEIETNKDRELQIKLAQLSAKLQADIAAAFGFFASALVWLVLAYQANKEDFNAVFIFGIGIFTSVLFTIWFALKTRARLGDFEKLH
jgi:lipopolysaccharide export LptBFGC system permease protein LptF